MVCANKLKSYKLQAGRGTSLIDVLFGISIFLIAFLGIFGVFRLSTELVVTNKAKVGALALANEQMEFLRSLSYDNVGTVGGIPTGNIPQLETIALNQTAYSRRTFIQYVDAPQDGLGALDENGITADYKVVKVEMSWSARGREQTLSLVSNIMPKGMESFAGGGTLRINVFNAFASPVPSAEVTVVNSGTIPPINVTTFTNVGGSVSFPGSPAASGYEITAAKSLYSTARTYDADAGNPNPDPGHLSVVEGETTTSSFAIDLLSSKTVNTYRHVFIYYVRTTGNDSNSGRAPDDAFATIGQAASLAQAGDIVYVGAGTYTETVAPLYSGAAGFPISYIADTGGSATGDAGAVILDGFIDGGAGDLCYAFDLSAGRSYLVIEGFEATRYRDCHGGDATYYFIGNSNNNIYRNLIAHDTQRDGIRLDGIGNLLENCLVYNVSDDGVSALSNLSNSAIQNCTFAGIGGHAVDLTAGDGTNIFENNIIDGAIEGDKGLYLWNYNDWTQGALSGVGNFSANPVFAATSTNDFHLQQMAAGQSTTSPAVDAGSDIASAFNLDIQTTRTDNIADSGQVDVGYHYIAAPALFSVPAPAALENIPFSMRGGKTIGSDGAGAPIYKYSANLQTDSSGTVSINNLEWDNYVITLDNAGIGYDIARSCAPQPVPLAPGASTTTDISLAPYSQNSLLVSVYSTSGELLSGARVRLYRAGFDHSAETGSCGQVFFRDLSKGTIELGNPYSITASLAGYQNTSVSDVVIEGASKIAVTLDTL
jgi:hypothetical protein